MSERGMKLSGLEIRGTRLPGCPHRPISSTMRLYYVPRGSGNGFDFYAVEWTSNAAGEERWQDPTVECVARGVAYYDGVRHLYVGDEKTDNYGYLYYMDMAALSRLFSSLADMEAEMCGHPSYDRDTEPEETP